VVYLCRDSRYHQCFAFCCRLEIMAFTFNRVFIFLALFASAQASHYTKDHCAKDEHGNEHCYKDEEDEPCFYEDYEERLYQWDPVERGYERQLELENGKFYTMRTVAVKPKLFEIPNFLTAEECEHIIASAGIRGLQSSSLFFDKFALANKNYTKGHSKQVAGDFEIWDKNGDGVITMEDIKQFAVNTRFLYLKDEDITEMFKEMKLDCFDDGEISREEFDTLNSHAINEYMAALRETHPRFRDRYSEQTWLKQDEGADSILRNLRERIKRLTKLPTRIIEGGEPLQVLHYDVNGHYHAHFDGQSKKNLANLECCQFKPHASPTECRLCRYITILYYLNDVEEGGETAFPVADDDTYDHNSFVRRQKGDFYNMSEFCYNSTTVVKSERGKAVMWYNHNLDEHGWLGDRDDFALHGGCDVRKGEKWVANNWIPAPEYETRHLESMYAV